MHKGGIADKVGNRYEARWLTYQLLGLLDGSVQSITVEALGDEDQGFEFSLIRASGTEWHQCKRQTATGNWSIPALDAAGVLAAFRAKIAFAGTRCVFISSDPARQLKLLQDKLPASHSLDAFVASLSEAEVKHWSVLTQRFHDDEEAHRFLGSTEFRTLSEIDLTKILRATINYWFKGDPDTIAARFRAWLEEDQNFNRPIGYGDVIEFTRHADIETKQYELDRALPGRIRDATTLYLGSYPSIGAGLFRIERAAVGEVLAALQAKARVVLVTGATGMGKSAVIAEVIDRLRADGTLHLAFRVDQLGAIATLDELGTRTVGIADNPVLILQQLMSDKRAVLIVDQADAVSEVSGQIPESRRVILDLARKMAHYRRVQLVFACRSFDLENDSGYRQIAEAEGNVRINIEPFSRAEIDPVLARLGVFYDSENTRLMALLALPIGLTLAATLAQRGISDLRRVEHLSELYDELLRIRDQEIRRDFRPSWSIYSPLTALAKVMSERQALVAPVAILDPFSGAADFLQRVGLILVRGRRASFIHESLFDYLHARAFVNDGTNLIDFLLVNEQTLFRRTQTRQILTFEREIEPSRYIADLRSILSDTRVRPHIRETIVRWLATLSDPTLNEWELVSRYAESEGLPRKAGVVIFERRPWFDLLLKIGVIDLWLNSDGDDLRWAFAFLRSVAPLAPMEVSALIDRFLKRRSDRAREALGALRFVDLKVAKVDVRSLADSLVAVIDHTTPEDWGYRDDDWSDCFSSWIAAAPEEAARIFGAQLARWFYLNPEGHPFKRRYEEGGQSLHWLNELAKAVPLAFLEQLLPFMRLAMERTRKNEDLPARDNIWHWRPRNRTEVQDVDLLGVVRAAFAQVARSDPQSAMRLLRSLQPEANITSLHLLLETIPADPNGLRDLLVEQLDNPGLFKSGWHCADAYSAGLAIASVIPWLTDAERGRVESMVLALHPEIVNASRDLARECEAEEAQSSYRTQGYATYCLNNSGKREWSVLRQIGAHQLSPRAAKRLAELDRKFIGQTPEQPDGMRGGSVRSPIAGDRTKHMNDHAWLTAIRKFSWPRQSRRSRDDGFRDFKGGARELSLELMNRVKEEPERFLALLARFPEGAHQDFACGVTDGIAEAKPNSDMIERVLAVVDANPAARPDDRSLIRLIRACAEPLGTRAEAFLLKIATGEDDSTGIGDIEKAELSTEPNWKLAFKTGSNLAGKSINSARASALEILGHICWLSKEAFDKHRLAIDPIIGALAPAHIHFSLNNLLMSALKHEGKPGVEWVLRTARSCPESFYSNNGAQIFGWVADLDATSFSQLINLYLTSQDPRARSFAGLVVFQRCLDDPAWVSIADDLISSDVEYRAAAAAVAAANFESARFGTICTDWLLRFFNDENPEVRKEASDCFRRMKQSDIAAHAGLFEAYAASPYFEPDQSYFIYRLKHAPLGLDDLLLTLLDNTLKARIKENVILRSFELRDIGEIVLRLYASNIDHPERQTRALDLIDCLVEHGLMEMQKLEAA